MDRKRYYFILIANPSKIVNFLSVWLQSGSCCNFRFRTETTTTGLLNQFRCGAHPRQRKNKQPSGFNETIELHLITSPLSVRLFGGGREGTIS